MVPREECLKAQEAQEKAASSAEALTKSNTSLTKQLAALEAKLEERNAEVKELRGALQDVIPKKELSDALADVASLRYAQCHEGCSRV